MDGEEVLFEKIPVDEAQRAKILPPAIDPVSLERAMTAYIADKLGMSVNIDVFRGCPRLDISGLSVMLKGEQAQSTLINQRYEFNVACFDNDRDKAMDIIHKLDCLLPIYGESISLDEENAVILKAVLSGNCNFDSKIVDNEETTNYCKPGINHHHLKSSTTGATCSYLYAGCAFFVQCKLNYQAE